MKLFYKAGACSLSPHIVLREAGLDFTAEKVDLVSKTTESGADYLAINPKGQVPALLLDDGSLLTEGVAIVQYLADRVPDRQLIPPAGTLSRYHAIEWLNFVATELHKALPRCSTLKRRKRIWRWRAPSWSSISTISTTCWRSNTTCWAAASAWRTPTCLPCCAGR
ncbi:Glutathione S-transferase GST-6.0 [Serratia rubidaea]|nr:Glutathione S-transferase GST-6.0 [Serratia rubidaea]